jgi:hypothetical protein
MKSLSLSPEELSTQVDSILGGLNRLLSNNQVETNYELKLFYLTADGNRQRYSIYLDNAKDLDSSQFELITDFDLEGTDTNHASTYLEKLPRRLYLRYLSQPQIRLPISLLLYETLQSASGPSGTYTATLWAKERDTVLRFLGALSQAVHLSGPRADFKVLNSDAEIKLTYIKNRKQLSIS